MRTGLRVATMAVVGLGATCAQAHEAASHAVGSHLALHALTGLWPLALVAAVAFGGAVLRRMSAAMQ